MSDEDDTLLLCANAMRFIKQDRLSFCVMSESSRMLHSSTINGHEIACVLNDNKKLIRTKNNETNFANCTQSLFENANFVFSQSDSFINKSSRRQQQHISISLHNMWASISWIIYPFFSASLFQIERQAKTTRQGGLCAIYLGHNDMYLHLPRLLQIAPIDHDYSKLYPAHWAKTKLCILLVFFYFQRFCPLCTELQAFDLLGAI